MVCLMHIGSRTHKGIPHIFDTLNTNCVLLKESLLFLKCPFVWLNNLNIDKKFSLQYLFDRPFYSPLNSVVRDGRTTLLPSFAPASTPLFRNKVK
jgi:hypothetical protein